MIRDIICIACTLPCIGSSMFEYFFFFQAEDGIRDVAVTGVQTCALPISLSGSLPLQVIPVCSPGRIGLRSTERLADGGWLGFSSTLMSALQEAVPPLPSSTLTFTV